MPPADDPLHPAPLHGGSAGASAEAIDWSQLWYPGPRRVFTADELARAAGDPPPRTLEVVVLANLLALGAAMVLLAPAQANWAIALGYGVAALIALPIARRLWRRPERGTLTWASLAYAAFCLAVAWAAKVHLPDTPVQRWVLVLSWLLAVAVTLALWFVSVYRSEQIASRLREMDERELARERARQLAAAQMQPHFLFNSLASLQHWVQTRDDRAAPMLAALCSFLRATLPLFDRPRLPLADEVAAARHYLDVMALRFGERLRYTVDVPPEAGSAELPPGLLLALVENAVVHGVEPSVHGAEVRLRAHREAGRLSVEVCDTGPGPAPGMHDGVGLANTRARLAAAYGDAASLRLSAAPGGGAVARFELPLSSAR